MIRTDSIPAISSSDQESFGHWLSGFADGEACFLLWHDGKGNPHATFKIDLRADDSHILQEIQSYLGCGRPLRLKRTRAYITSGTKPQMRFDVNKISDLANIIVPHFLRYPLRAKKRGDFAIWQQGVMLIYQVSQRPRGGRQLRWSDDERSEFHSLLTALREHRIYKPA